MHLRLCCQRLSCARAPPSPAPGWTSGVREPQPGRCTDVALSLTVSIPRARRARPRATACAKCPRVAATAAPPHARGNRGSGLKPAAREVQARAPAAASPAGAVCLVRAAPHSRAPATSPGRAVACLEHSPRDSAGEGFHEATAFSPASSSGKAISCVLSLHPCLDSTKKPGPPAGGQISLLEASSPL